MAETTNQLELPYVVITAVANRATIRDNSLTGRFTYWIDFDKLKIRDGFNLRKEYKEIPELAKFIETNGVPSPLVVDMMPDGSICYIEQGHRRFKALELLVEKAGGDITAIDLPGIRGGKIECFVNEAKVDELTRLKRQFSSNNGEKYTSLEMAELCGRMEQYFGLKPKEIAKELGISRQHVENFLILFKQSDQTKQAISSDKITPTAAITLARNLGDADRVTEKIEASVASGKAISVKDAKRIQGEDAAGNMKGEKDESTGEVFDESRDEIRLCQNVIKNVDKVNSMISKLGPEHDQLKGDIDKYIGYIQKDMVDVRQWVKKNKKK